MTDSHCQDSSVESDAKQVYARAIKLLARREHTKAELHRKLLAAGFEEQTIADNLLVLEEKGYQSDQRFAELFVEQRFKKGFGELDILVKLGQRGVDRHLADSTLAAFVSAQNIDWYAHASAVLSARFDLSDSSLSGHANEHDDTGATRRANAAKLSEGRQKKRRQWSSYLLRRGFSNDQVMFAIENPDSENQSVAG